MKKMILISLLSILILSSGWVTYIVYSDYKKEEQYIHVNGIENFLPDIEQESFGNYLLFYPSDWRTSQDFTLVKEVTTSGDVIKQYKIMDDEFRRMTPHQRPHLPNQLFISFFGDTLIDNFYFTYDIQNSTL